MPPARLASTFGMILVTAMAMAGQASAQMIGAAGQEALETGRSGTVFNWRNPDDGTSGSFVPRPAFQDASGRICREFNQTVTIGGQLQQVWGTACRQPDGWWQLQHAATDGAPPPPRVVSGPAPVTIYTPPPVVYDYRPVYVAPAYRYARPYYYYPSIQVGIGGYRHHHRHRHW